MSTLPQSDGGYKPDFLGRNFSISLPALSAKQKKDLVKFNGSNFKLDYIHYSAVLCKSRRFAYFTAVNIDGSQWQNNSRDGSWKEDSRISSDDQAGGQLYSAAKSDFDKGHLVRREDPEWGTKELSLKAGANTFYFPNSTPQHKKLNREIWAELEVNILHTGAEDEKLKVSVFTGPVLSAKDKTFVTPVWDSEFKIPSLFWKVVVWTKSDGKAYAVGFIQSQEKFLLEGGIIKKKITRGGARRAVDENIFEHLKFKDGKTYQVNIKEIEKLTGLSFDWKKVVRPFKKSTPKKITGRKINPDRVKRVGKRTAARATATVRMKIKLSGLVLNN